MSTPGAHVWEQLHEKAMDYLDTVSLQTLIDSRQCAQPSVAAAGAPKWVTGESVAA